MDTTEEPRHTSISEIRVHFLLPDTSKDPRYEHAYGRRRESSVLRLRYLRDLHAILSIILHIL